MNKYILALVLLLLAAAVIVVARRQNSWKVYLAAQNSATAPAAQTPTGIQPPMPMPVPTTPSTIGSQPGAIPAPAPTAQQPTLYPPVSNAKARITKKPFGIHVLPGNSPVTPERFHGYHTGVDFETLPSEQNIDVAVNAICNGTLLRKDSESGYGGVAVESCNIAGQPVTVVYGHLRLSSITAAVGAKLSAGQQIAVLGTGFTAETSGERKHLHLGIHKGNSINTSGYVATQAQLKDWIDPGPYFQ